MKVIPDLFEEIVNSIDVSDISGVDSIGFYYGNPIEIDNTLKNENIMRTAKYPAIFLVFRFR